MIAFNFLSPSVEMQSKMAANIKPGITDKRFLELEISKWLKSDMRRRQIEGDIYYEGKHEILKRERTTIGEDGELKVVKNLPNNRIVDNQYAKMVDQKANYLCGKAITFDTADSNYGKALAEFFSNKMQRLMSLVAERSLTGGVAWICPYYNENGVLSFSLLPAHEVLPFWRDTAHTELDCAVHFFPIYEYDEKGKETVVEKVEVYHAAGIDRFIWKNGTLITDNDAISGSYVQLVDENSKQIKGYNWARIPLVCFKSNHREQPLLCRVKSLQDALNLMLSNFANTMEEDVRNTVLVLHNYDGEDLGEFRKNLAVYGAIKVRSIEGSDGSVDKLEISVNSENFKTVLDLLKKAIIENARGYDAKDERLNGSPNQLNIRSMYSDIDLDANGMETEFQAAFEELLFFINAHFANTGKGNFEGESVRVIFNRDILINESEAIEDCGKSAGIISNETIVKMHPWVDNPEEELTRIAEEKIRQSEETDAYRNAFESGKTMMDD